MRLRKCKRCNKEFHGEKEQRLCQDCRLKAAQETVIRPRICITCGVTFQGGPRARYCPKCREERTRKTNAEYRERKRNGKVREIGSIDICQLCGTEYTVESGMQRYCPSCAPEAIRQNVLPQKRERAAAHIEEKELRRKTAKKDSAVCAYCGKVYTSTGPSVTCSEECAREYNRIKMGMIDYTRGKRKTPPTQERYSSGLPQSDLPGVSYHRRNGKWQVSHKGKYIGIFDSKEEAEAKKRDLLQSSEEPPD